MQRALGNAKTVVARPFPVVKTVGTNVSPRLRATIRRLPIKIAPGIRTDRGNNVAGTVKPYIGGKHG